MGGLPSQTMPDSINGMIKFNSQLLSSHLHSFKLFSHRLILLNIIYEMKTNNFLIRKDYAIYNSN